MEENKAVELSSGLDFSYSPYKTTSFCSNDLAARSTSPVQGTKATYLRQWEVRGVLQMPEGPVLAACGRLGPARRGPVSPGQAPPMATPAPPDPRVVHQGSVRALEGAPFLLVRAHRVCKETATARDFK